MRIFLAAFFIALTPISCTAMLASGFHAPETYIHFAKTRPSFKAACYVRDTKSQTLQSGVLIAPTLILTAAHGVMETWKGGEPGNDYAHRILAKKTLYVGFGDYVGLPSQGHYVKSITLHSQYLSSAPGENAVYDIAILELEKAVEGITPLKILPQFTLPPDSAFYVVTYGSADLSSYQPIPKRAFMLFDIDPYTYHLDINAFKADFHPTLFSSVFFEPLETGKPPNLIHQDESEIRTQLANQKWHNVGRPPYALALPGSSGAPVIITLKTDQGEMDCLIGLVNSFTHLSTHRFVIQQGDGEVEYLLKTPLQRIYGKYQTVVTSLYHINTFDHAKFKQDTDLIKTIEKRLTQASLNAAKDFKKKR